MIRAIEITLAAAQPMSEVWKEGREPLTGYRILRLGLDPPRAELYERINRRAAEMFAEGLVEETRALVERYGRPTSLSSLGYRQALEYLDGKLDPGPGSRRRQPGASQLRQTPAHLVPARARRLLARRLWR